MGVGVVESSDSNRREEESVHVSKVKSYLHLIRPPFLVATSLSMILGIAIAWVRTAEFDPYLAVITITAGVMIHAGTNVSNDYFDHLSGNDDVNKEFVAPYTGGSRMIQLGRVTPHEVLALSLSLLSVAIVLGAILASLKGYFILMLGAVGVFSGFCYAAPPIRLASRGVGEPLVGLNFGVLLVQGAYYVQTESIMLEPIISSIPIAATITAVLWINEFPDFAADKAVGKHTMVVRLGKKKGSRVYISLVVSAYLWMTLTALGGLTAPTSLVALSTLPLAAFAIYSTRKLHNSPSKMGPPCGTTVAMHLLFVSSLVIGYVLLGFAASPLFLMASSLLVTVLSSWIALHFYREMKRAKSSGP